MSTRSTQINNLILVRISEIHGADACMFRANVKDTVTIHNGKRLMIKGLPSGTADLLGCIRGRAVGIETKIGRDRQRQSQIAWQWQWENAGGLYVIVGSVAEYEAWDRTPGRWD